MRRAVYLLLFVLASPCFAQTCTTGYSSVQAAKIIDLTGAPLASGTLSITGVDANRNIINFGAPGGGAVIMATKKASVANGALIGTLCVPRSDMATVYIRYHIVITDNSSSGTHAVVLDANDIAITADVFSLDAYPFPADAYANPPNTFTSGNVTGDLHVTGTVYAGTIEGATAANATHAISADSATNATHATTADSATTATTASSATTATNATHATTADSATTANTASALAVTPTDCGAEAINGINADGSPKSCLSFSATPFPTTNGGVYNTSQNSSRSMTGTDINTILGYTPATGPNFTNDFIACYLFLEPATPGGSLPDHCGSNNGVVGTTAPVATGIGWQFTPFTTSGVILPAALNNAKSYYFVVDVPPALGGNYTYSQINTMLGGTVAGGLDINASGAFTTSQPFGGFEAFSNGIGTGQITNVFNGVAILTLVCDTPKDRIYFDGQLSPNLDAASSCGRMASGSFQIGASADSVNFSAFAAFFDLRVSNNAHTDAQVAQNVAALKNEMVGRGISFLPDPYQYPTQQLFFAGDSITCGYATGGTPPCAQGTVWSPGTVSSNAFTNHLVLDQTFGITNFGASGAIIQQQVAAAPQIYAPFCGTQSGNSIAVLFEGTNNGGINTPSDTWNYAASWAHSLHAAGCKTIYISMISRGGTFSGLGGGTYESFKSTYNASARANWKQAGFDAFVDMEADPLMGCDGCNSNATYFMGDLIHPSSTGQLKLALAVQAAINYLSNGSTPANPNPTAITSATHTSAYEDGGLVFNTATNNIVDTLTSAQWMSGRIISRCNTSTAGSNTLTITAPSDYPFNNVAGLTTVTVANNVCQKFQATFVAGTPNGDYWRLIQ